MQRLTYTTLPLLLATLAVLGLSACAEGGGGEGTDSVTVDSVLAGQQRGGMRQGMSGGATPQSTITMLRKGVRNIAVNQAVQNINGWQEKLQQQSGDAAFSQIDDNLGRLKNELTATDLDAQAIADLLSQLGQQTTKAAQNASGPSAQQLQQLGTLLSEAGNTLTGGGS
jgi:hypothetical protein